MLLIRRILVPVNFTDSCLAAGRFAEELASRCDADLFLVHVLEPLGSAVGFELAAMFEEGIRARREAASCELQTFLNLNPTERLQRVLLDGDAATEIVRFAHNESCDLILMPTRGFGVLRRLLLGSVTAKVLHDADCPVWTGVHPESLDADGHMSIRKVVCAVDLGPQTRSALAWARQFADHWHADLGILHVLAPVPDPEWRERLKRLAHEQLLALQAETETTGELHLEFGEAHRALPAITKHLGPDLLVIGRGHISSGARLGGSAYAIMRDSPCPVISV
jgi:nucleotide-binding universal stress UspA family protein